MSEAVVQAPEGVEFEGAAVFIAPTERGTLKLNVEAFDACGNKDHTALIRTVIVQ